MRKRFVYPLLAMLAPGSATASLPPETNFLTPANPRAKAKAPLIKPEHIGPPESFHEMFEDLASSVVGECLQGRGSSEILGEEILNLINKAVSLRINEILLTTDSSKNQDQLERLETQINAINSRLFGTTWSQKIPTTLTTSDGTQSSQDILVEVTFSGLCASPMAVEVKALSLQQGPKRIPIQLSPDFERQIFKDLYAQFPWLKGLFFKDKEKTPPKN